MRRLGPAALALGAGLALASCAVPPPPAQAPAPARQPAVPARQPAAMVLLLADPDGKVGSVTVTNEGGSRTLDRAGSLTRIADARTAPTEPAPLSAAEADSHFGAALGAQPAPPLHFILYFRNGSTELTAESREAFPAVVAAIRERASADTSIVGHTDTSGDARKNFELSLARARAVAALLDVQGIDPGTLEITSHGEANLLVPTGDNVPEPRNRRVEVTVR